MTKHQLVKISVSELKRLGSHNSNAKTKLSLLRILTVILVVGRVEIIKKHCDAESPLNDHLILSKAHEEFLALNGLEIVEDLGPFKTVANEYERTRFLNWFGGVESS